MLLLLFEAIERERKQKPTKMHYSTLILSPISFGCRWFFAFFAFLNFFVIVWFGSFFFVVFDAVLLSIRSRFRTIFSLNFIVIFLCLLLLVLTSFWNTCTTCYVQPITSDDLHWIFIDFSEIEWNKSCGAIVDAENGDDVCIFGDVVLFFTVLEVFRR